MQSLRNLERKYSKKAAGDLAQVMRLARSRMGPSLREHSTLVYQFFNLINIAGMAASGEQTTDAKYVCANLLARIARDLLALISLAADGLSDQTSVVAASTYESAVTIGAIGNDDSEARRWLNHADRTRSIESVRELSLRSERNLRLDFQLYELYRTLCVTKHGNPASQRHSGRDACREHSLCSAQYFFPTGSARDQFVAGAAIEIALFMADLSLLSFIRNHVDRDARGEFLEQLDRLDTEVTRFLSRRADSIPEHCATSP